MEIIFQGHILTWIVILSVCTFGETRRSSYVWTPTDIWSPCSRICGVGDERQVFECGKSTSYNTLESAPPNKCKSTTPPIKVRVCSRGLCPQADKQSGSFVWRTTAWTKCPKQCGGGAFRSRDVNCFLLTAGHANLSTDVTYETGGDATALGNQLLVSKLSKCDIKLEPQRFVECAAADCSPRFITTKWKRCPPANEKCRRTIRRREVKCATILRNGTLHIISQSYCHRQRLRPPQSWQFCYSSELRCQTGKFGNGGIGPAVKISIDSGELHQMRFTKRLKVVVGQTAYVFSGTRVALVCPLRTKTMRAIQGAASIIVWHLGNSSSATKKYRYRGERGRIKVNRRGSLVISTFLAADAGEWMCEAGKSKAIAVLRLEMPSTGFKNWLKRYVNRNYGMLNEESELVFVRPESILWMKSEWSECPTRCNQDPKANGGHNLDGFQRRRVTCEKVETRIYKIIENKKCPEPRPISQRPCKSVMACPEWIVVKRSPEQCTEKCVALGRARTNAHLRCQYLNSTVDPSICEAVPQPDISCRNTRCQIQYSIGSWSQCSMSCSNSTSAGIQSRALHCVWQGSTLPASDLCYRARLPHPAVTRICRVPPCILDCKDLSPVCVTQSKDRCRSSLFFHYCCSFCRKNFPKLQQR